jgi:hypothetical protein
MWGIRQDSVFLAFSQILSSILLLIADLAFDSCKGGIVNLTQTERAVLLDPLEIKIDQVKITTSSSKSPLPILRISISSLLGKR